MNILQSVIELEKVIQAYHERNGTFNFHYSHFDLMSWRPWMVDHGLTKKDDEVMGTEEYAVQIAWTDNSNSYDSYTVLLSDIIAWHQV